MKKHKINIKKYRELFYVSQNKLAIKIGISQSYLSAVERGEKSPTLRMIYKISDALDVCPRLLIQCKIKCENCKKQFKCNYKGDENNESSNIC